MFDTQALLERLCAHHGIARDYYDVLGQHHVIPERDLVALLAEFGVDASTRESIESALCDAEMAQWQEGMPAVAVLAAGTAPWKLRVHLADGMTRLRQLHWALQLEDGTRVSGELAGEALQEIGRAEFDGRQHREVELVIDVVLPQGYHVLSIEELAAETHVIATPECCYLPSVRADSFDIAQDRPFDVAQDRPFDVAQDRLVEATNGVSHDPVRPELVEGHRREETAFRIWGPAVQLYGLRSARNWGIGDFTDLKHLVEDWGRRGADIVGLNPLHALFPHNPQHISPYSPSSRLGLNVLYLDVEAIEDFHECRAARDRISAPHFQARLARLRDAELVDYAGAAAVKCEILELLYWNFRERHLAEASVRAQEFRDYQMRAGNALRGQALFEALQEHFHARDAGVWGWPTWPLPYRDCGSAEVKQFCDDHLERVEWFEYLQWQADLQLGSVHECCHQVGMRVGLYLDLAVSVDRAGADVWRHADEFAPHASVGAPPDDFNLLGQNWGLPPLRPDRLVAHRYHSFIDTMRTAMRHAGAIRIDHVLGLMRLFWIPQGCTARHGAYVHYPLEDLLAIVALESQRNRCMVIGEDLGTVADELRAALARRDLLSYKLLWFERDAQGDFKPPEAYAHNALVAVSTHDLATLAGWWSGEDLLVRLELGLYPTREVYERQLADRAEDRKRLLNALHGAQLFDGHAAPENSQEITLSFDLLLATHAFVARTPARVMMVQLEDALGVTDQANLPATVNEHPNWRRKLPLSLEQIAADPRVAALTGMLSAERPRAAMRDGQANAGTS